MDLDVEMDDAVDGFPPQGFDDNLGTAVDSSADEPRSGPTPEPESDSQKVVLTKIHIRGLDSFNPDDVKGYVTEHYGSSILERVEWIDDTSANLIFKTESEAQEALVALAAVTIADASQLPPGEPLPAKQSSKKPDSSMQVRYAVETDRKKVGAAQQSRFYLLHPEYDPEERRRREGSQRGRYRDRDGYRRGRRRCDEDEPERFEASMYDDDAEALTSRAVRQNHQQPRRARRRSQSSDSDSDYYRHPSHRRDQGRNEGKELFPDRRPRNHTRNRSRSPGRDRNGDHSMDDDARGRAASRNRDTARSIKDRLAANQDKELFPSKVSSSGRAQMDLVDTTKETTKLLSDRNSLATKANSGMSIRGMAGATGDQGLSIKGAASVKELFPDKFSSNAGKELFADKLEGRGRRRQKAEDLFY